MSGHSIVERTVAAVFKTDSNLQSFRHMVEGMQGDVARYAYYLGEERIGGPKQPEWFWGLVRNQGLQALVVYRFGKWIMELRPPTSTGKAIISLLSAVYSLLHRITETVTGVSISRESVIGPGLYIPHFGGVIIGTCTIGSNCTITNGAHVGPHRKRGTSGTPILGDRVWLGPGSKVFGAVEIGDDVAVGANAVVTKSVPARAVVFGVPAQISSFRGSFDLLEYLNMDEDLGRCASMRKADLEASCETREDSDQ